MWPSDHNGPAAATSEVPDTVDRCLHHRRGHCHRCSLLTKRQCRQQSRLTVPGVKEWSEEEEIVDSFVRERPISSCNEARFRMDADIHRGTRSWSRGILPCRKDVFVFVIILTCSLLNGVTTASPDFHFPDIRQGHFIRNLDHFHISRPTRVDHKGEFLSLELNANNFVSRQKRSAEDGLHFPGNSAGVDQLHGEELRNEVLHYKIPLSHEQHVVVEVATTNFLLAPSAVVERKVSKFRNISDSIFSHLDRHKGCHVAGQIHGEEGSRVALSVCDGLRGFLQLRNEDYLIEPVKGHNYSQSGEGKAHVVYKRSALPDHLDFLARAKRNEASGPSCGVDDAYDRAIANRERWERHARSTRARDGMKTSSSSGHSRSKRSISTDKHVETLVVVDTDMVIYYENEDLETYVLTVMNMVASLFHDASIGNAINIVIVRILLMQDPDDNLKITHHADKTLKSFCKWQKSINFRDDDHPNHHDVAVLLTRRNICSRMNEPCSTLGLAQVAGLCQPHRTCSINEDTGLSLAWTVAHELGHNFGMKHDNPGSGCVSSSKIQYVMAPHLTWDRTPSKWSNCSRASITKFLDRNWGYCLDDPPGHHDFTYPELPAGTMYDADHQCRLLYGGGAERCNGIEVLENICTTLWCRVNNKCSTKLQAAVVGTICGTNKWCFAGECVDIGERPQAIDGQWGEWSEWTKCTRTCGAGVSVSQRHCSNPPPSNGGKYCTGERKRYRICNTDNCPDDAPSFRSHQCAEFNNLPYKGVKYTWEPISTPDTPCQLHCKPNGKFFSVLLKDIVTDGTPCVLGSRHMCISGRCRHIGCDWKIDSSATEDRCGVCYGDGSTCKTIKQQFNETKKLGYVEATVIPTGARNIRVEEVAEASNFLALRNDKGEYYLNGHWFIQWSGDYEMAGTVIHYKRKGNKESFLAPGPLKEPLHIMLLMQTHNPGVEFEYTVPKENATDNRKPEFSWDYMGWSHCTVSCGGGTQRSQVVCKEQEAGVVDEVYCNQTIKPDDQLRSCNDHLCPARWWTGSWQHCTVTCGDKGIHRRTVICVRSLGSDEQIALEDTVCEGQEKPVEVEPCHHKDPCPGMGVWELGDWSNCTRQCNGGVQFRKVICVGGDQCVKEKPIVKRACNMQPCLSKYEEDIINIKEGGSTDSSLYDTKLRTSFSPSVLSKINSISSNTNLATNDVLDNKDVVIQNTNSGIGEEAKLPGRYNLSNKKSDIGANLEDPVAEEGEEEEEVLGSPKEYQGHGKSSAYVWQKLDWSKCSSQCGQGVKTRIVVCIHAKTGEGVSSDFCDLNSKPSSIEQCRTLECLDWQTGDWGECSATCGYATQSRQVLCTSPGRCDPSKKPEPVQVCENLEPCIAWVYGDWSKCSKSCGTGSQERLVQCVNLTSQQLTSGCKWNEMPDEKQECNTDVCPEDVNAALTISCESNEMSYNVCRMLKKVGLCHKQYVQAKCCRTCYDHTRPKPDKKRMSK